MLYVSNGSVSHKQAVEKAYQEYDIFNKTQPIESDFDKIVKGLAKKKIITFPDYVIMIQLWKIVFYESNKLEFYLCKRDDNFQFAKLTKNTNSS